MATPPNVVFRLPWKIGLKAQTQSGNDNSPNQPAQSVPTVQQTVPPTQESEGNPMPASNQERLSHHKVGALVASAVFGITTFVLVVFSKQLSPALLSEVLTWWALVCGAYIVTQLVPLAVVFKPLEEWREKADLVSTTMVVGLIWFGMPIWFIARGEWPNWWAERIWLNTIPFSICDVAIMLILYKISRATVRTAPI